MEREVLRPENLNSPCQADRIEKTTIEKVRPPWTAVSNLSLKNVWINGQGCWVKSTYPKRKRVAVTVNQSRCRKERHPVCITRWWNVAVSLWYWRRYGKCHVGCAWRNNWDWPWNYCCCRFIIRVGSMAGRYFKPLEESQSGLKKYTLLDLCL